MSNIITKTYNFENNTASSHFSKSGGMNLGQAGLVSNPLILWYSNSGTATMNNTGKSFLYPKAGIHPFKADYSFTLWNATDGDLTANPSSYMNFYFKIDGNTIYHKEVAPGKTSSPTTIQETITDDTNSAILNSTSSSSITFEITAQKNGLTQMCGNNAPSSITFYYQQWDLIGQKVGNGRAIIISPGRLYAGESGTFKCIIGNGSTFHGWYSDSNHTQLVSNSMTYTTTASQDLTLYAYVIQDLNIIDDLYFKSRILYYDGTENYTSIWKKPISYYLKTINGWERKTDKNSINKNMDYILHINENCTKVSASGGNVTSSIVYKPYPHIIFYKTTNPRDIILDFSSSNNHYSICPMEDGFGILFDGIYYTGTSTVTIISTNTSSLSSKNTYTLTCSLTTETKTIYFIDKNGNPFTETFTNNQPYTVTTPTGYTNFTGWREYYNGTATGRVLTVGNSYYDVGDNKAIHYEPVFSS